MFTSKTLSISVEGSEQDPWLQVQFFYGAIRAQKQSRLQELQDPHWQQGPSMQVLVAVFIPLPHDAEQDDQRDHNDADDAEQLDQFSQTNTIRSLEKGYLTLKWKNLGYIYKL